MRTILHAIARTIVLSALLVLPACFVAVNGVAHTLETSDVIHISSLHNIEGDFYAFGNDVQIDGSVAGDLVCASSQSVIVRGQVGGSTNEAGLKVNFSGNSTGSVRLVGNEIQVFGTSGRSLIAVGSDIIVNRGTVVEEDAAVYGTVVRLDGWIKRNVKVGGATVIITGQIDGNVQIEAEKITIAPPASISGKITYTSKKQDALVVEPGATVLGETTWKEPEKKPESKGDVLGEISTKVACLFASFFFGLVVTGFFRPYAEEAFKQLRTRFTTSFAAGLLGLLSLIFAVIVLLVALLLMGVAYALLTGETVMIGAFLLMVSIVLVPISSFAAVVGGIVFYSAVILVGYFVGHFIRSLVSKQPAGLSALPLLIGLAVLTLVFWLPFYVGSVIWLFVSILGAGAIILGIKNCRRETVALRQLSGGDQPLSRTDNE